MLSKSRKSFIVGHNCDFANLFRVTVSFCWLSNTRTAVKLFVSQILHYSTMAWTKACGRVGNFVDIRCYKRLKALNPACRERTSAGDPGWCKAGRCPRVAARHRHSRAARASACRHYDRRARCIAGNAGRCRRGNPAAWRPPHEAWPELRLWDE